MTVGLKAKVMLMADELLNVLSEDPEADFGMARIDDHVVVLARGDLADALERSLDQEPSGEE